MFVSVNFVLLPSAHMKERVGAEINGFITPAEEKQAELIINWQVYQAVYGPVRQIADYRQAWQ